MSGGSTWWGAQFTSPVTWAPRELNVLDYVSKDDPSAIYLPTGLRPEMQTNLLKVDVIEPVTGAGSTFLLGLVGGDPWIYNKPAGFWVRGAWPDLAGLPFTGTIGLFPFDLVADGQYYVALIPNGGTAAVTGGRLRFTPTGTPVGNINPSFIVPP